MAKILNFPPVLFSPDDAAAYLNISVRKLDELQAKGEITPRDVHGKRGFHRDDLEAFAGDLPEWMGRR